MNNEWFDKGVPPKESTFIDGASVDVLGVLANASEFESIVVCFYDYELNAYMSPCDGFVEITHWQYLPNIPNEVKTQSDISNEDDISELKKSIEILANKVLEIEQKIAIHSDIGNVTYWVQIQENGNDEWNTRLAVTAPNMQSVPHAFIEKYKGVYPPLSECYDYRIYRDGEELEL